MATEATSDKSRDASGKRPPSHPGHRGPFSSEGFPRWAPPVVCAVVVVAYVAMLYFFFVGPLSFRWRAIFGEPDYPKGYDVRGIDISHYQKGVRWDSLRRASLSGCPLSFVIVKATEGVSLVDEDFADNFSNAHSAGFVRGAYHFFIPSCSAAEQAEFYLRQVCLVPGDLPPILDVEKRGDKPLPEFQRDVKEWLDIVQAAYDVAPIIYTNLRFKKKHLSSPLFDGYPLWLANFYRSELDYDGDWTMWQYTDLGRVDGIDHNVDLNLFNGNGSDFLRFLIPVRDSLTIASAQW